MNAHHHNTILLGLLGTIAILASAAQAQAMDDPVTGRWMTRDPLHYNPKAVPHTGEFRSANNRHPEPQGMDNEQSAERVDNGELAAENTGMEIPFAGMSLYEYLASSPSSTNDPSGLICAGTCPMPGGTPTGSAPGWCMGQTNPGNCRDCCHLLQAACSGLKCFLWRHTRIRCCYTGCNTGLGGPPPMYWPTY